MWWRCGPTGAMASLLFLHRAQRRSTLGRTPLDECVTVRHHISSGVYNSYFSGRNKYSVNYGKALNLLHSLHTKDTRNVKQAKAPKLRQLRCTFSHILAKSRLISFMTLQNNLGNYEPRLQNIPYSTVTLFHASPYRLHSAQTSFLESLEIAT